MTLSGFLAAPRPDQWTWAIAAGWPGPDGSSMSTDRICGVRIGIQSPAYEYHALPANRHDWRYLLGRLCGLPEAFRAAADRGYRDGCLAEVRLHIGGPMLAIAIARCHLRYAGLRLGARFAWTRRTRAREAAWVQPFGGCPCSFTEPG